MACGRKISRLTGKFLVVAVASVWLAGCTTTGSSNRAYSSSSSSSTASYGGPTLHISDASYQAAGGQRCDPAYALRRQCEGEQSCRIESNNRLCGDPARGLGKDLVVGYKCGRGRIEVRVPEGRSMMLAC